MAYNPEYIEEQKKRKESSGVNPLGILGGMTALVGVSIAMPGATRSVSRFGSHVSTTTSRTASYLKQRYGNSLSQAGSFVKSLDHALEGQSPFALMYGDMDRMSNRFSQSYSASMEKLNVKNSTFLKGMPTRTAQNYQELIETLSGTAPTMHFNAARRVALNKRIESSFDKNVQQGLKTILTQQEDTFFNQPSRGKIDSLLSQHSKSNATEANNQFYFDFESKKARVDFTNKLFDTLSEFKNRKSLGMADREAMYKKKKAGISKEIDTDVPIQSMADFRETLIQDFLTENKAKHTGFLNKMFGNTLTYRNLFQQKTVMKDGKEVTRWENNVVDKDFISTAKHSSEIRDVNVTNRILAQINKAREGEADKWLDLAVDSRMFIKDGKITDLRGLDEGTYKAMSAFRESFQVPFLKFNPLDLLHFTTYEAIREAPKTYFMRAGTIQPWVSSRPNVPTTRHPSAHNQDAKALPLANDHVYSNGKVYNVATGEIVKDNMFLGSARFGAIPRMAAGQANLHRRDYRNRNVFAKLFDVGAQETQSIWNRGASVFTKFADDNWEPNTFRAMFNEGKAYGEGGDKFREGAYKNIYAHINQHTSKLDDKTLDYLSPYMKEAYAKAGIELNNLDTPEEVMSIVGQIAKGLNDEQALVAKSKNRGLDQLITQLWSQYNKNSKDVFKGKRLASEQSPFSISVWQSLDEGETKLVDKLDDIRRLIHQHGIEQINYSTPHTVGKLVKDAVLSGELGKESLDKINGLNVLTKMQSYWDDIYRAGGDSKDQALFKFFDDVTGMDNKGTSFGSQLYAQIKRNSKNLAAGPGEAPPQNFGLVGNLAMEKGRGYKWMLQNYNERVANGEDELIAGAKSLWGVLGQPFAGRGNMDQVTAATTPFYYFAERLDNAMAKIGLGLSEQNRGSMQSILFNQFGRRVALPYVAYQQATWLDDQFGNAPSEFLADTYVRGHVGMAGLKETMGLNALGDYFGSLTPGMDQIGKIPTFSAIKHATFGLIGDNRSAEEVTDYYESGEDEIRKGRWWALGSNTPWEGGKIDYYTPNWYRRMKSNYQYTDTMYGSSNEYWANNWMPTLTNPLAPIRHFITDTNHWEKKHRDDRPYPVQGGIAELQMIPLVGPILDNTAGRIVKPRVVRGDLEKQHRAYLEEVNAYIQSQYYVNTQSGYLDLLPAGGYQLSTGAYEGEGAGFGSGMAMNAGAVAVDGSVIGGGGNVLGSSGGYSNVGSVSRGELASMNASSMAGGRTKSVTSLQSLRDPDMKASLDEINNPYGLSHTLKGLQYNLTETGGIYGFSYRMFTGQTDENPGLALDQSTRMTSYNRAFWDADMGGLGNDFSEIFRRYVPRDPNSDRYNPIRNTMPDWMPGVDYFVDFQHGDPYAKIKRGEIRLPGKAYESVNKLHPDMFGEYGAFDRFKILADVAPYSDQYAFWRKQVSSMNEEGMLTSEMKEKYQTIRDQVSSRKDKYHYYPYQFKNAKIDKQEVTVTRVLDAETFLTAEHPNNPIKLAGVTIPSAAENAQNWLYEHIHEGAKLTIGIDADPLFRVRDDTMNTIRAVAYSQGEKDLPFYLDQKGQSLNSILVNRDFGDEAKVKRASDNSAVGTAAFYDSAEITVGKMWESVIHNLDKVPVLGPILDKFIQVRSPLELYKKNELYGKSWKPWYDPWSGWIEPMLENTASFNPLLAAGYGYGIGHLFGANKGGKRWGPFIGATVMGGMAASRALDEAIGRALPGEENYAWIPERRQKEREVNEYFDILKYMKYKGLYERTAELAKREEGIDLNLLLGNAESRGERNKKDKEYYSTMKKWLSIQEKIGYHDEEVLQEQLNKARERLGAIGEDRSQYALGPYAMQAMQYRSEYESTLYGADANGDLTKIYRAMPSKEREFFQHFMNAAPDERQEILKLVPKDQRRFYQAKWGMKVDEKTSLESYFLNHNLPGSGWEGWRPDVNLDSIKVKVLQNEGLELTEFGMWEDDVKRAEQSGVDRVNPFRPSMILDPLRIEKVLHGAGLKNVNVTMQVAPREGENKLNIAMDIVKDRTRELLGAINENLSGFI